jgi:hypothetical protein
MGFGIDMILRKEMEAREKLREALYFLEQIKKLEDQGRSHTFSEDEFRKRNLALRANLSAFILAWHSIPEIMLYDFAETFKLPFTRNDRMMDFDFALSALSNPNRDDALDLLAWRTKETKELRKKHNRLAGMRDVVTHRGIIRTERGEQVVETDMPVNTTGVSAIVSGWYPGVTAGSIPGQVTEAGVSISVLETAKTQFKKYTAAKERFDDRRRVSVWYAFLRLMDVAIWVYKDLLNVSLDPLERFAAIVYKEEFRKAIDGRRPLSNDQRAEFSRYLTRFRNFLLEEFQDCRDSASALADFKARCEWYSFEEIKSIYRKGRKSAERQLTMYTCKYLHDRGFLPIYNPKFGRNIPDFIDVKEEQPLIAEVKVVSSLQDKKRIRAGFKQIYDYISTLSQTLGYLLIFNFGAVNFQIPPSVSTDGREIVIIEINVPPEPPSIAGRLRVIQVTEEDLVSVVA